MASAGGLGWPDGAGPGQAAGSAAGGYRGTGEGSQGLGWPTERADRAAAVAAAPVSLPPGPGWPAASEDSGQVNGIGGDMGRRRGPAARDTGEQGDVVSEGSSSAGNVVVGGGHPEMVIPAARQAAGPPGGDPARAPGAGSARERAWPRRPPAG